MTYLVDTSAFFALINKKDVHHSKALEISQKITSERAFLLTTDYILDEAYTIIRNKLNHPAVLKFHKEIITGSELQIMRITERIFDRAWDIFKKYSDKRFSFTDCTSFVVMEEEKLSIAFTFDRHFLEIGFKMAT